MNESPPSDLLPHAAAIERINLTYWLAARDAARDSVPYAMAAFGLPQVLAQWLAGVGVDRVLALARLPTCAFAVRVPPQALERVCARGIEDADFAPVVGLHTVLKAVGGDCYEST